LDGRTERRDLSELFEALFFIDIDRGESDLLIKYPYVRAPRGAPYLGLTASSTSCQRRWTMPQTVLVTTGNHRQVDAEAA
jgi:hypothetical protein